MEDLTVLIIDDEEAFRNTLTKRLSKRNIKVFAASGGDEGLGIIRTHPTIDVVILDVKMPHMDGLQTMELIKQDFPHMEVIFLTGHATIDSAVLGMKKGAFDYLMKPCFIEELIDKITKAAEKKRAFEKQAKENLVKEFVSSSAD